MNITIQEQKPVGRRLRSFTTPGVIVQHLGNRFHTVLVTHVCDKRGIVTGIAYVRLTDFGNFSSDNLEERDSIGYVEIGKLSVEL